MITLEEYKKALEIVNAYRIQLKSQYEEMEKETEEIPRHFDFSPETLIEDAIYTTKGVRLWNAVHTYCLRKQLRFNPYRDSGSTISMLSEISLSEFKAMPNQWKKTVQELQELCDLAGVKLKP